MQPSNPRTDGPLIPPRQSDDQPDANTHLDTTPTRSNEAAANIVRGQIDSLYGQPATENESTVAPPADQTTNPYHRTHSDSTAVNADQWKQYHSAWQDYYQKYYERYYVGQVHEATKQLESELKTKQTETSADNTTPQSDDSMSKTEAMNDLRSRLRASVRTSAKKARGHRLFIPITAAVVVMIVFAFLQYNRTFFAVVQAYVVPSSSDPQPLVTDPNSTVEVGPEPKLYIPKVNVEAPIDFNATPANDSQMAAMEKGVAYFGIKGANSRPGQKGNVPISGHSSNGFLDNGNYKFIFAPLERLSVDDTFYVNYQSKRYTYKITRMQVVQPSDVKSIQLPGDKPYVTLITCTPLGTAEKRLLVIGEQVSPDPASAKPAPASTSGPASAPMPGNSPTWWQRITGGGQG